MVKFQINDKHYQTPDGWDKVTFGKYLDSLNFLEPRRPTALRVFLEQHQKAVLEIDKNLPDDKRQEEAIRLFEERWETMHPKEKAKCHKYMAFVIGYWCEAKTSLIQEAMNLDELEQTFWVMEYELNPNNAEIDEQWAGFEINGVWYLPPKEHMKGSTVVEFAESAQFQSDMEDLENGNWKSMSDVMVVLCRPKDEPYYYEEEKHEERKKLFRGVTMDNVINTAFFLLRLNKTLNHNLLIYTLELEQARREVRLIQSVMDGQT